MLITGGQGVWLPSQSDQGVVAASSSRASATLVAGAANVWGAWVELVAATTKDVTTVSVALTTSPGAGTTNSSTLLQLALGASGSEAVKVPDLPIGYSFTGDRWEFPLLIPAGSRIACRIQSAVAAENVGIMLGLRNLPPGSRAPLYLTAMGTDPATRSYGVALPVPVANVKTAWTVIQAATAEAYRALLVGEQGNQDTVMATGTALVDIGLGPTDPPAVIINDVAFIANANEYYVPMGNRTFPVDVPAGSKLWARWASSTASNSMDVSLLGVPA